MSETLAAYLKRRAERHFRYLYDQIEGITESEARADRLPGWPGHRWGIGQDGSIAGIVYHVAAWKQLTLPLFAPGGQAGTAADFDATLAPPLDDWPGLRAWLRQVGAAWNAELARLPESAFDETREWEGTTLTMAKIVTEMLEHDLMHASQIEYLRQRQRALR
jgi:hypothetical protein